ncbi:adenine-specific DNA-methyltransferase [Flavobacterium micromati]|uniref:site-specific DNA-methyltransferase (adenine-specific) n=1 Tax=Flavobacterium micromati TaxID=229205 RepID=A0A1M5QYA7_9FLAO|nr:site-specific DNA-methyltransferase [Flavobacterium micromati]SHH18750.1 adenine-specific DNA-methyltransferase [Flavobacterium micromati]
MQNLQNDLIELLKHEDNLVVDGYLNKNKIIELALKVEPQLIIVLLKSDTFKKHFFQEVENVLVFDKIKFQRFVNNKSFLPDSYTAFKNKIGLITNDDNLDNFISTSNDVVLAWPHKDCVLEGGQTKEDQKRNEIFWNETLAPDSVDRLLDAKAFTNFTKFDKDGEHKVTELKGDENLIIKGNNLLSISSLLKTHRGKIKLIYLDIPYNTGGDGFNYNDSFSSSTWLTFIKNRLQIAKKLLTEDGLIFIQIDSSRNNKNGHIGTPELPYLNVMLDEVFFRKNYIGMLHWKKKKQPSFLSKIAGVMEVILIYSKNESNVAKLQIGKTTDTTKRIDNSDNKISEMLINKGIKYMGDANTIIKKGVYQNKTMSTEFLEDVEIKNGRVVNDFKAKAKFRTKQTELERFANLDLLYITESNSFRRYKTEEEDNSGKTITDLLLDWGQNQDATAELRLLFDIKDDSKPFETPKPELLLHNIIECCTKENDIVLDFFVGSGTTAAVAHKMKRKYIGIEQMEYVNTIAVERLKKVINGEQGGVSKNVNWQGGGSFVYAELMQYNQKYIDQIQDTTTKDQIINVWNEMQDTAFLSYQFDKKTFNDRLDAFKTAPLEDMKQYLVEVLDKNQLYVNYSEIADATFNVSEEDKKLNKQFYSKK